MGAALFALALRLAGRGAAALGLPVAGFALLAGLALGAGPGGYVGFLIGRALGWTDGAASADRTAQINTLTRDLAEARADATNARASAEDARATSQHNAAAAARAQRERDRYAHELANHGPARAYPLSDDDVRRLRRDAWVVEPGGGRPHPAARR